MSYRSIVEMATSASLRDRIMACAAECGVAGPLDWTNRHIHRIVATNDWGAPWDYAQDTYNINMNPDTGARLDVISDEMILTAVTKILEPTPEPAPADPPAPAQSSGLDPAEFVTHPALNLPATPEEASEEPDRS